MHPMSRGLHTLPLAQTRAACALIPPIVDTLRAPIPSSRRVPVYGPFYDEYFEVCLHHRRLAQPWCWNDLLIVRRAATPELASLRQRLLASLLGPTRGNPFLNCPLCLL